MSVLPLLEIQRRIVHVDRAHPGTSVNNVPVVLCARGHVDVDALVRALRELPKAFPQLGGRIDPTGHTLITSDDDLEIVVHQAGEADEAGARIEEIAFRPFDIDTGPLARAAVVLGPETGCHLVLVLHHVVADAASLPCLVDALSRPANGPASWAHVERAFAAEQDDVASDAEAYWRDQVASLPPLPDTPVAEHTSCTTVERRLGPKARSWVHDTARRLGVTPMAVVLAAWELCLGEILVDEPHAVLMPMSTRHFGGYDGVWPFIETAPVISDAAAAVEFDDLTGRVWQRLLGIMEHPRVPYSSLLQQPGLAGHLTRFLFSWQEEPGSMVIGDTEFESVRPRRHDATFQLALECAPTVEGYVLRFEHRQAPGVIDVSRVADRMACLLDPGSEESAARWSRTDAHRRSVDRALAWGRGGPNPVEGRSLLDMVLDAAAVAPTRPAVQDSSGQVTTYGDLVRLACSWRERLTGAGVVPGDVVGTHVSSSAELVAIWLGAWSLGAAFLANDPRRFSRRTIEIFNEAEPRVVVGDPRNLPGLTAAVISPEDPPVPDAHDHECSHRLRRPSAQDEVAYLIYTSGSTGSPKGIRVPHRAVARLVGSSEDVPIRDGDRVSQFGSISFDSFAYEFWGSLARGATLVIPTPGELLDPGSVEAFLDAQAITAVVVPAAVLNLWVQHRPAILDGVRLLIFGGEKANADVVATILGGAAPPATVINGYGPSETATAVTHHHVAEPPTDPDIPIGRPTAGATITVLDPRDRPVPVGSVGEVWVTGPAVGLGYVRDPADHGFRPHPIDGAPAFRTGDLASWTSDGLLRYHGRIDDQVKIRGMRVEPAEVESVLQRIAGVGDGAVVVLDHAPPVLRACYVGDRAPEDVADELRRHLPGPMVPAEVLRLEMLPVSGNGKVDRAALAALTPPRRERAAPATDAEQQVHLIWTRLLEVEHVSVDEDFFDIGGHSLLVATLAERLAEVFGHRPAIADLMSHRTVSRQARLMTEAPRPEDAGSSPSVLALRGSATDQALALIHPVGGTCGLYAPLAHTLGLPDLRVIGLQAPGIDGQAAPLRSVEELARYHLGVLDALGVEPPFLLAGISMGGSIAYEMGRLSLARGDEPPFIALLDTPGPGQLPTAFADDAEMLAAAFAGGDDRLVAELRTLEPLEMFRRILGAMSPEDAQHLSVRDLEIFADVWRAHSQALLGFTPRRIETPVHYYKATTTVPPHPPHPELPWRQLLGDALLLTRVEGTHESIIERPHVTAVAAALDSDIRRFREVHDAT